MVDLVKIRKKAKQKKAEEQSESAAAEQPSAPNDDDRPEPEAAPAEQRSAPPRRKSRGRKPPEPAPTDDSSREAATEIDPSESLEPRTTSKLERFKAEAGKRREEEIREEKEEGDSRLERLTFVIAGEAYAVDIDHIVEIVTPRAVTRIPNADPAVVGIVSLRGTIVTLVDVRRKLGHPPAGAGDEETRVVVVELGGEMIGFIVDRVLRVIKLAEEAIEPHPVVHATELDEAIRGVFRVGDALTILLDLDKLLDHDAFAATTA